MLRHRWPIRRVNWVQSQMVIFPMWPSIHIPSLYNVPTAPSRKLHIVALQKQRTHVQVLFRNLQALLTVILIFWIYSLVSALAISLHTPPFHSKVVCKARVLVWATCLRPCMMWKIILLWIALVFITAQIHHRQNRRRTKANVRCPKILRTSVWTRFKRWHKWAR